MRETNAYRQITWRTILQPDLTQSTTIKTLMRLVRLVFDILHSLSDENRCLKRVIHMNNYNAHPFRRKTQQPTETDETNRNTTLVTIVLLLYYSQCLMIDNKARSMADIILNCKINASEYARVPCTLGWQEINDEMLLPLLFISFLHFFNYFIILLTLFTRPHKLI